MTTTLPETVTWWLGRLQQGWTSPVMKENRIIELRWGDKDLSTIAESIRFENNKIVCTCNGTDLLSIFNDDSLRNKPMTGRTSDGMEFHANFGNTLSLKNFSVLEIGGDDWSLVEPNAPANIWIGEVDFVIPTPAPRNLRIDVRIDDRRAISTGIRLQGERYTYYIVDRQNTRSAILVDTGTHQTCPDRQIIHSDKRAIEFSLGQKIHIHSLHAVEPNTKRITGHAQVSHKFEEASTSWQRSPVPNSFKKETWAAPLFQLLSKAFAAQKDNRLTATVDAYIKSISTNNINDRYLRLHIALGWIARMTPPTPENHSTGQARDDEGPDATTSAALSDSDYQTSVRSALTALDIPLSQELDCELERGNTMIRTGIMDPDPAENIDHAVERVQLVQSTLVAMIAKHIGYFGAILGWKRDKQNEFKTPEWWHVDEGTHALALETFLASIQATRAEMGYYWPKFDQPTVPTVGLLSRISSFANSLVENTNGDVTALLHPIPGRRSNQRQYEFKVFLSKNPGNRVIFFTTHESDNGSIFIQGWTEDDIQVRSEEELASFLRSLVKSEEVIDTIDRMMILADEIRHGER